MNWKKRLICIVTALSLVCMMLTGSGFYSNTTFEAEPDGKDLIVTGGVVKGEVFSK